MCPRHGEIETEPGANDSSREINGQRRVSGMTDNELNELFKALRQSDCGSAGQEARLKRLRLAFRARYRPIRVRRYLMEIAASIAVALGLYFVLAGGASTRGERAASTARGGRSEFVVLPYGQNDVPLEHPVIVRVQVPETELSHL